MITARLLTTPTRCSLPALLAGLCLVSPVAAAEQTGAAPQLFSAGYLLQIVGSLLLVTGCIFGLIYLLKKLNGLPVGSGAPLRVLGSTRVGSREKIVLLQAGEQQLLLGVAAGNVRTLHVFDEPIMDASQARLPTADFATLLRTSGNTGGAT